MPPRASSRTASVQAKSPPAKPRYLPAAAPAWLRPAIIVLAAFLLIALYSVESADTDTWWHLKTGQYILEQHKLPVPDPFAWTTYLGKAAYRGEETTRYFNLTHEWLSQVLLYGSFKAGGFTGLILMRALWLTAFCMLPGWIA